MKRIICIIMAIAILASFVPNALASNNESKSNPDTLTLIPEGHGQYGVADQNSGNSLNTSSNTIMATATEDKEIYHIDGNTYVSAIGENTYLSVDKIVVNVDNLNLNDVDFQEYQVPDSVVEELERTIAEQKAIGNNDLEAAVFAPAIDEINSSMATTQSVEDVLPAVYYYTGNFICRDYMIKYYNMSTGMVNVIGSNAWQIAGSVTSFLVTAAGLVTAVAAYPGFIAGTVGASALAVYESLCGPVVYGSSGDQFWTNVIYDKIWKQTDVQFQSQWYFGCISEKVWYNRNDVYQFYAANGQSKLLQPLINQMFYTQHYLDPGPTAVQYFMYSPYQDSSVTVTLGNTTCIL